MLRGFGCSYLDFSSYQTYEYYIWYALKSVDSNIISANWIYFLFTWHSILIFFFQLQSFTYHWFNRQHTTRNFIIKHLHHPQDSGRGMRWFIGIVSTVYEDLGAKLSELLVVLILHMILQYCTNSSSVAFKTQIKSGLEIRILSYRNCIWWTGDWNLCYICLGQWMEHFYCDFFPFLFTIRDAMWFQLMSCIWREKWKNGICGLMLVSSPSFLEGLDYFSWRVIHVQSKIKKQLQDCLSWPLLYCHNWAEQTYQ